MAQTNAFNVVEATIEDIHTGYKSGKLTCHQLVQMYLDRIEAFDKKGPNINALITINADALKEADRLDAAYKASGPHWSAARHSGDRERSGRCQRHADDLGLAVIQRLLSRS